MSRPSEKKKLETLNCIGHLENVTILEKISIQNNSAIWGNKWQQNQCYEGPLLK